jgi:hypothetical protein
MQIRVPVMLAALGLLIAGCGSANSDSRSPDEIALASAPAAQPGDVQELTPRIPGPVEPPVEMAHHAFPTGSAVLRGPHFGLGIDWVATGPGLVPRYHPELDPFDGLRAADGQELMVISIDPQFSGGQWQPPGGASDNNPAAELIVDGHAHVLSKVPLTSPTLPAPPLDSVLLAVSVRKNAPVELQVNDAGRTQTINVRTGVRVADAIPGYYRPTTQTLKLDRPLPAGIVVRGVPYPLDLTIAVTAPIAQVVAGGPFAMLAPWTPDQGWAAPGHAWLVLPSPTLGGGLTKNEPVVSLTVDDPAVCHVRLPDGTLVPALAGTKTMSSLDGVRAFVKSPPDLTFNVPADFTTGTYLMDLSRTPVVAGFRDGDIPARWQPAPAVVDLPLNLSD